MHLDLHPVDGLDPELTTLLATLQEGTNEIREELGDVPEDAIVWQPYDKGHSIGGVLLHNAEAEAYWFEEVAAGRDLSAEELAEVLSEEIRQYEYSWPVPPRKPLAYYYSIADRVRERTIQTLRELNNPMRVSTRPNDTCTLRWILAHVVGHESYHGGQAVLLKVLWEKTAIPTNGQS